jgi:hypothetical protein
MTSNERVARKFRLQSWLHAVLGVIGLAFASYMIYPKAQRIIAGEHGVLGRGAVANVALVLGSLMFLRNARYFRRRASASLPREASQPFGYREPPPE